MSRFLRAFGALLAASLIASCDTGAPGPGPSSPGVAAPVTPATSPASSGQASSCAREAQPRRLLKTGDVWPAEALDAWSQIGYQLDATCDHGPPWPRGCDPFSDVLSEGWPGYRTEGASYIAAISLLNTSGKTVEEQVLLFANRSSSGLTIAAGQARACQATTTKAGQGATVYLFPPAAAGRRALVVDQAAAIMVKAPADIDFDKLIEAALRRERAIK
jgi:hypothetical protein